MPALSPTIMCSHMLAGASAASSTIGGVVVDVETVIGASSGDAFAFEMTIASACREGDKKCCACGRVCVYQNTLHIGLRHAMDSINTVDDVSCVIYTGLKACGGGLTGCPPLARAR